MKLTQNKYALILLSGIFILLAVLAILSDSFYEGADNVTHYNIARYAFQYPGLFLHHWGKPVFTLLSSPFAQFGIKGIYFFNIMAGLATAFLAYRIARQLGYATPVMAIIFVSFTPLYFMMQLTALTEVLFSLVLMASIYLAIRNKYVLSAILLSFLPFVRNEGFILFPLFFLYFVSNRRYKAVLFMFCGFLLYSLAGLFYFGDFLWLFHQNPYKGANSIYGSGSLFHFATNSLYIIRKPLLALFITGVLMLLYQSFTKRRNEMKETLKTEWLLIFLPFCFYFTFHSVLWWKGAGSSLGLLRVLAGVTPLLALIALKGFNFIDDLLKKKIWLRAPWHILVIAAVVWMPFIQYAFPVRAQPAEACALEASQWLRNSPYASKKIFYFEPIFQHYLDLNPYDNIKSQWMFCDATLGIKEVQQDGILIYDTHFGPNEGALPLDTLMSSKQFRLLKVFRPAERIKIMGRFFEIYIFLKVPLDESIDNNAALKEIDKINEQEYSKITGKLLSFEAVTGERACVSLHKTGKRSVKLFGASQFSPAYTIKYSDLSKVKGTLKVLATASVFSEKEIKNNPFSLVITMEHNGVAYDYYSLDSEKEDLKTKEWNEVNGQQLIEDIKDEDDLLKVYLWYRGKDTLFADDLDVIIYKKK